MCVEGNLGGEWDCSRIDVNQALDKDLSHITWHHFIHSAAAGGPLFSSFGTTSVVSPLSQWL